MSLSLRLLAITSLVIVPLLAVSAKLPATSANDPFHAITLVHRARQPEPPLCCLKPLPTGNPPEGPEDVLLSFEEWKSRAAQQQSPASKPLIVDITDTDTPSKTNADVLTDVSSELSYTPDDTLPPHFRVPTTDRFNYANMDCSARIHTSHKSAKSAWSILSSKKDKYMLSPCSADPQFVVIELCDDIRIDTVQLANFEFFSGVFKDFSVSVAKTYTGSDEGWTPAGTYYAKNIRGVQSFHPPTSLRDFYRYIRIDFHSHYGHEYYCPVSLLRVYGLTHLEEWKWDTWLAESRARLKDAHQSFATENPATSTTVGPSSGPSNGSSTEFVAHPSVTSPSSLVQASITVRATSSSRSSSSPVESRKPVSIHADKGTSSSRDFERPTSSPLTASHSITDAVSSLLSVPSPPSVVSSSSSTIDNPPVYSHDSETHTFITPSSHVSNTLLPPAQQAPHAQSALQWSGESIYRTIMNRLAVLEANHTLYARYVEEQTTRMREVLRKLNEEVGRLETVSRMQAQMYQRTVHEWERQRLRLELEHGELLSRVNFLSDEVVLEKRLGIAQLCLLLAVLVFIGLTRGAPSAHHPSQTVHRSALERSVRNLSFGSSTEGWSLLRGRSRSPTELRGTGADKTTVAHPPLRGADSSGKPELCVQTRALGHEQAAEAFKVTLPSVATVASHTHVHPQPHLHWHKRGHTSSSAFRTPTKPRPLLFMDHNTLPRAEPLTRSQSSSTSGFAYARSTRRWARTAHLHEIKGACEQRSSGGGCGSGRRPGAHRERENRSPDRVRLSGDMFSPGPAALPFRAHETPAKGRLLVSSCGRMEVRTSEESTDGEAWVDTDVDVDLDEGDEDGAASASDPVVLNSPECDVFRL